MYFLITHIVLALIYSFFIITRRSFLRRDFIPILFLIPIAGILAALLVDYLNVRGKQGEEEIDLPSTILDDDILWKSLKRVDEEGNIIPLEEALLINDNKTRREMILKTLYDDPKKYLDVLMIARHNEDVETSHYATTVISNAQREFQIEVQQLSSKLSTQPDDIKTIDRYIDTVEIYINSGLLEEILLRNQRITYGQVLDQKLALRTMDKQTVIKKIRNHLELNESFEAYEAWENLKNKFPEDEETWIEALRICIETHDDNRLRETLTEINSRPIYWTTNGKNKVEYWLEGSQ
jgi:hypothetical protein